MAANPLATFALPPLACAARFLSGLYLPDANPWLLFLCCVPDPCGIYEEIIANSAITNAVSFE